MTGTFLGRMRKGELSEEAMNALARKGAASAPLLAIGDARDCYADPQWIFDQAEITKADADGVLVVIDSLHSWVDSEMIDLTEYERIGRGITILRTLAAELDSPVLYIAERNRFAKQEGGTGSGAGSRKIEYGAETQIDLNREKHASPDMQGLVEVTARFTKNRAGSPNRTVQLWFHGAKQTFREDRDHGNRLD